MNTMWVKEFEGQKGLVVVIHGLGEHSKRYEWLVELLRSIDYGVTLFDLPGHGESPGVRGHLSFKKVFEIVDNILNRHPNSIIFGHSLGGLLAIRYVELQNSRPIRSLIVTSPALNLPNATFSVRLFAFILSLIAPSLTLDNRIDPDLLSTNKEAVRKYVEDPLVHRRISGRLAHEMFINSKRAIKEAYKITSPCFVGIGTQDKITLPDGAREFFKLVSSQDKLLKNYEGCFHEIFEDESAAPLFKQDLVNWILTH